MQYYVANKVAPPVHHVIQPFDRQSISRLCDVTPSLLPDRWRELMVIQQGVRHRSRETPFALRPLVSQVYLSNDAPIGITPLPALDVPTSTPISIKRKPRGRTKSTKKNSDTSQANIKIMPASQPVMQILQHPAVLHDDIESGCVPSYIIVYDDNPQVVQVFNT